MKKEMTQEPKGNPCPNCGKSLSKDAVFCYACNTFLSAYGTGILPPEQVTDEDIQRLLDRSKEDEDEDDNTTRGKIAIFFFGIAFFSFLLIFVAALFDSLRIAITCMGVVVVSGILSMIIAPPDRETKLDQKEIEEIITKYIAAVECKKIYGDETIFEPEQALPEDVVARACFYNQGYSKYKGNRLIQGTYKGYPFRASHVNLTRSFTHNGYKRIIDIFDGYCMSIDTDLIFPERIRIIEKYFGCLNHILGEGEEESSLFYEVYNVKSDHKEVADHFLTPMLRKNIILASETYAGTLAIVLNPDGNIFIAAGQGENAFTEGIPAKKIREEYRKELSFPLKVLECFLDH